MADNALENVEYVVGEDELALLLMKQWGAKDLETEPLRREGLKRKQEMTNPQLATPHH